MATDEEIQPDDEDVSGAPKEDVGEEAWEYDDESDLRRRSFLERHDWMPWIAAAIVVGGTLGLLQDGLN